MSNKLKLFTLALLTLVGCNSNPTTSKAPIYEGLGNYEMPISSNSEEAKHYFKQGLAFMYGYNYPEAIRSFQEAAKCDPESGMCYYGAALSASECIEKPGDKWCVLSYHTLNQAQTASSELSNKERDLIAALQKRFDKRGESYQLRNRSFIEEMRALHKKYPDDPDIAAIYANFTMYQIDMPAGMVNGRAIGEVKEVLEAIEKGLEKHPDHPGLNHFYIHAVEAALVPKRALPAAENLVDLVPISGHLQHMPAHTFYHFGRYHDASIANQKGIDADAKVFAEGGVQDPTFADFYLHNHYYLFHSLTMEGRSKDALAAARKVIQRIQTEDLPSDLHLKNLFYSVPYVVMARLGMWNELYREPHPNPSLHFTTGAYHYAKGLAEIRRDNLQEANRQFKLLKQANNRFASQQGSGIQLQNLTEIFLLDLEGSIAAANGDKQKHIQNLEKAVAIEDSMYYGMLPWYMPLRQAIGQLYLDSNQPQLAERYFKSDLKNHPKNGWALYGLIQSLKQQNKHTEAKQREAEFKESWKYSDIALTGARL